MAVPGADQSPASWPSTTGNPVVPAAGLLQGSPWTLAFPGRGRCPVSNCPSTVSNFPPQIRCLLAPRGPALQLARIPPRPTLAATLPFFPHSPAAALPSFKSQRPRPTSRSRSRCDRRDSRFRLNKQQISTLAPYLECRRASVWSTPRLRRDSQRGASTAEVGVFEFQSLRQDTHQPALHPSSRAPRPTPQTGRHHPHSFITHSLHTQGTSTQTHTGTATGLIRTNSVRSLANATDVRKTGDLTKSPKCRESSP